MISKTSSGTVSFFSLSYLLPRVTGGETSKVIILQVQVHAVTFYVSVPQATLDQAFQEASEHHPEPLAIVIESKAALSRNTPEGGDWITTSHLQVLMAPYDHEGLVWRKLSLVCSFCPRDDSLKSTSQGWFLDRNLTQVTQVLLQETSTGPIHAWKVNWCTLHHQSLSTYFCTSGWQYIILGSFVWYILQSWVVSSRKPQLH